MVEKIYDYTLEDIMGERFGRYSKSIIQDRALPDVRDGLKPVQRRILYTMWEDKNTFDKPYRKCAKAVGDVMGKYHPHGDSSIYGAMIYMSQPWKMREVFIDIHGNNGSIDGDGPAAYRYTETRLTKLAEVMLKDINRNSVEMTLNYSDEDLEPTVLPANFPNLLVNGSTGISAGYATNIPPHNLSEVIDATIHRIDNPKCDLDSILNIVQGPDFPTGGVIEGKSGLINAYTTGRGKVVVKAKTEITEVKGKKQIVIHEIPYDVVKENLRKKIEDIKIDKKIEGIADVIDVSDKEHMAKLIIELKKDANAELILNYLFKNTDLQVNYNFNMVAIVNKRPKQLGIIEILDAFILHQKEVILRRTKFDLEHAKARLHIVEGLLKAMDILDEIIKVIRKSKNKSDSIDNLVKTFDFTVEQATAIVTMQLYRLSNTDVNQLLDEKNNLNKMIEFLNSILNEEKVLKKQMKKELNEIKKAYGNERRTLIKDEITEIKIDLKEMIPKEDVVVVVTHEGYVKRVSLRSFQSTTDETTLKEGDYVIGKYLINTLDTLLMFTDKGNYLYIPVHEIPDLKWKDLGKHVSNIIKISQDENIVASMKVHDFNELTDITIFTKNGMVKRSHLSEFMASRYSKPITCIKLKNDDEVVSVCTNIDNTVSVITYRGYIVSYDMSEIPVVGLKASGVKSISLKNDYVVSAHVYDRDVANYLCVVTLKNTAKRVKLSDIELTTRARRGVQIIRDVKTNPYYILKTLIVNSKSDIKVKTNSDLLSIKSSELPIMDRLSTGSMISKEKIVDIFNEVELVENEEKEKKTEVSTEEEIEILDLDKIDEKIMTIDDFLDDFDV
ncbi:MAG: DNA topoisomerase IV subunit A [Bacilli bacterium]|nr:DNA topoisomerase IV subunit A [Bacilli bacterium]